MKSIILTASVSLAALGVAAAASAQEDGETAEDTYIYSTYLFCSTDRQGDMDAFTETHQAPVWEQAKADGAINDWAWIAHHTGGEWRRLQVFTASSLGGLLDAQDAIGALAEDMISDEDAASVQGVCPSHEDYIWKAEAGAGELAAGDAMFSVYMICDESREARADEIMMSEFKPVLDQMVADGKFSSWGWLSHWVGGEYRRVQTMTAADHKALLAARDEMIATLYQDGESEAGQEFSEICNGHQDYMWNVQLAGE